MLSRPVCLPFSCFIHGVRDQNTQLRKRGGRTNFKFGKKKLLCEVRTDRREGLIEDITQVHTVERTFWAMFKFRQKRGKKALGHFLQAKGRDLAEPVSLPALSNLQ